MSRIGKKPITLPAGVEVTVDNGFVQVKGPKGALEGNFNTELTYTLEGTDFVIARPSESNSIALFMEPLAPSSTT